MLQRRPRHSITARQDGRTLTKNEPIGWRALTGYGIAGMPAMYGYFLVLVMYMKYASVELGISTAVIGTVFFVAKCWDAVSDPMVGYLSDRTQSRFGRRRPWLIVGAPLIAAFTLMTWAPPSELEGVAQIAWITVGVLGFYTAYTIFEVPHMSLGAELSLDSNGRNRVFGLRQALRITSMMLAAASTGVILADGRDAVEAMIMIFAALTLVMIPGGIAQLPPEREEFQGKPPQNPFKAVADVCRNPHARLLLTVLFIDGVGAGGIGTLAPFVLDDVVGHPELVPALLLGNMGASLLAVPIWIRLARRFEKRHLMLASMLGSSMGYGSIVFVGEGDWPLVIVSSVIAGASSACPNILGYTLKAEIVDYDEHQTGERKEGAYFAGWAFVGKLATGVMIALAGWALAWSGYDGQAAEQTEFAKRTMVLMMGGFPLVCYFVGALLFSRFRLTEADHARIRVELDARSEATR